MAEDRITSALRGPAAQQPPLVKLGPESATPQGDGSQQSGYAGPEFGPFECENCAHFEPPSECNHPQVVSDPEVNGQVDPEGCCNFFQSAHNETQEEEHGDMPGGSITGEGQNEG